jgi:hypothetical protein
MQEFEASKIGAVRRYLDGEFPDAAVADAYNFDREAQDFRIGHGVSSYLVTVSREFFRVYGAEEIKSVLQRLQLAQTLRNVGRSRVIVTTSGIRVESP